MTLFVVALVVSVPTSIWRGFVASVLWGWFIVPLTGLPPIGVALAIGIGCVTSVLFPYPNPTDGDDDPALVLGQSIAKSLMVPLLALLFGWVALQFVDVTP